MATPSSGTISLLNVQTEFGGGNPIAINEYYKADLGVPTSGAISLNDLRGKTRHATKTEISRWFSSTNGVYRRVNTNNIRNVVSVTNALNGNNIGTFTANFTPNTILNEFNGSFQGEEYLKNCVENTVVWFSSGDGRTSGTATMTNFKINGVTVTPAFDSRGYANIGDASSLSQFSVAYTSPTSRFTAITSATATHPNNIAADGDNQHIGGAFIIPGKWNATTNWANHQTGLTPVTLEHGDILLVGWHANGNVTNGQAPFNESVNAPLVNASGNILPNYCYAIEWYDISGVWIYTNTSGATRTYNMPNIETIGDGSGSYYKHAVTLKFAPDQYYGQQS